MRALPVMSSTVRPKRRGRLLEHDLGRDRAGLLLGEEVGEDHPDVLRGERLLVEVGEGGDAGERALELADVVGDRLGDELQHLVGDVDGLALGLLAQDGEAGLEVRWLDVGDQAPLEPRAEAVLEGGDVVRGAVRRHDDLPGRLVEGVEGVEELLLEALLALDELDVVDEEDVGGVAVLPAEGVLGAVADRLDVVVQERLGGDVADSNT